VTVAFYLPGDFPVYAFSLLIGVAASLGLGWSLWGSPDTLRLAAVRAGLVSLSGGLLGARMAYLVVNWGYYQGYREARFQLPLGGLSWPGALIGGALTLVLYCFLRQEPFWLLADSLLPLVFSLTLAAWLGCWLEGCAYGPRVDAWYALPLRDEWGERVTRLPLQWIAALSALATLWGTDRTRTHAGVHHPGRAASLGLFALSLQLGIFSTLRADPAPQWNGLRLETWAALGFTALAALALLSHLIRHRAGDL
jgi:hypothetical protein